MATEASTGMRVYALSECLQTRHDLAKQHPDKSWTAFGRHLERVHQIAHQSPKKATTSDSLEYRGARLIGHADPFRSVRPETPQSPYQAGLAHPAWPHQQNALPRRQHKAEIPHNRPLLPGRAAKALDHHHRFCSTAGHAYPGLVFPLRQAIRAGPCVAVGRRYVLDTSVSQGCEGTGQDTGGWGCRVGMGGLVSMAVGGRIGGRGIAVASRFEQWQGRGSEQGAKVRCGTCDGDPL